MGKAEKIVEGVWLVGGPNISMSEDATVFVIDFSGELIMIDTGAGRSARTLVRNIESAGLDPKKISTVILTHCHIDHIGAAPYFRENFGCKLAAHELDARAIEEGDPIMTAANWYETDFPPTPVDIIFKGDHEILQFGAEELHLLHTPGHTPGSMSIYLDRGGKRVLFGQDIHGPFLPSFKSDVEPLAQIHGETPGPRGRHPLRRPLRDLPDERTGPEVHPGVCQAVRLTGVSD